MDRSTRERLRYHLGRVYTDLNAAEIDKLAGRLLAAAEAPDMACAAAPALPGSAEVVLITYADTFLADVAGGSHVKALTAFCNNYLADVFSTVHLLPFFPSSSDGGFAVVDYRQVADATGDWADVTDAAGASGLMVDLVCNHGSAQSEWFANFITDSTPGRDYYLTADPDDDLGMVTRPRTHPLLKHVETDAGPKHVWATFSHDQVDFDFSNPDVLVEFCSILGFYQAQGANRIRLDAIAYLWKQIGTSCVHLPETHQIIKIMRALIEARDPQALVITETNVPHRDNVSYFGDGDEAHVVYNFTLAPLIAWSLVSGQAETLSGWLGRLESPPPGCTFLNFLASHDGIGLRPVEDLIPADALQPLVDAAVSVGGDFSAYSAPGGPRPYELNVSLADLLAGPDGETSSRFVLAHALMLAVQGIPAIYVHSMLATAGDTAAVAETGHKRDINRARLTLKEATAQISSGWRAETFQALSRLIKLRRSIPAFSPHADQIVHVLHPQVVAIERGSGETRVLALHNLASAAVQLQVPPGFGLRDLIADESVSRDLTLDPWQARWLRL